MVPRDLLRIAVRLASGSLGGRRGRPRQTELRRGISAAYYAMFHTLALCCANQLAGVSRTIRSQAAWRQTYRSLEHGDARSRCQNTAVFSKFPIEIRNFADQFVFMQHQRHSADYDPDAQYLRLDVLSNIRQSERAITQFNAAPKADQRAFALYVLLRSR